VHREHVDLLVAMHRVPQPQARAQLEVTRLEHAFEQKDRAAPAERAHPLGLLQVQQRETVGAAQRVEHALDPVAIGIGLDHGPDLRVARGTAQARQVVAQGGQVDRGADGAGHGFQILALPRVI
jgi:hypothetical protein